MTKSLAIGCVLFIGLSLQTNAQSGRKESADEAEVRAVNRLWATSRIAVDKKTMERILADDLIYVHARGGEPDGGTLFIEEMVPGPTLLQVTPYSIRIYGNIAVVMGRIEVKSPTRTAKDYYSRVYSKDQRSMADGHASGRPAQSLAPKGDWSRSERSDAMP